MKTCRKYWSALPVLADHNVNVLDMANKSRGDLAYNILDVEQMENGKVISAIQELEHVTAVRLIDQNSVNFCKSANHIESG